MKRIIPILTILFASMLLSGCAENGDNANGEKNGNGANVTIKFGVLPIEDTFPIYVAKEEGLFAKQGVDVEVNKFQSAMERDSALTADEVDGVVTDPLAVILHRNSGYDFKIVSIGLGMKPEGGVFAILANAQSNITSVEDLEGKKVGISSNTIIEYVTDRMLAKENVEVKKEGIKSIPLRLQMLTNNNIDAATLPEPLASLAAHQGANLIISDADMNDSISQTVIVFDQEFIDENPGAVENFLQAYGEAVEKVNSNPDKYRELFIEKARVPDPLTETYRIPHYPQPQTYPKEFYQEVNEWAEKEGLIKKGIPYGEAVYDRGT
ncbi:MAG: MetQ/NlpA family ABC transporter substrate-binding protein [Archaeoglobaceae archaeon]